MATRTRLERLKTENMKNNTQNNGTGSSDRATTDHRTTDGNGKRRSERNTPPLRMQRAETPERWWAKLGPVQRAFAHEIAGLVDEVTDTKRMEIRRERGEV